MNYTREQAERVIRDYNNFLNLSTEITYDDIHFLDHKFPKKVSGWYRNKPRVQYLVYLDFENNTSYGFDVEGDWFCHGDIDEYEPSDDYLATPQEVEQRLIEEAKRRGFVKGVRYKSFYHTNDYYVFDGDYTPHEVKEGGLCCHRDQIMLRGKWAEIIEQPETELLENQLNKSFDDILYEQELKRTIKKAEKIAEKLEKLLSL